MYLPWVSMNSVTVTVPSSFCSELSCIKVMGFSSNMCDERSGLSWFMKLITIAGRSFPSGVVSDSSVGSCDSSSAARVLTTARQTASNLHAVTRSSWSPSYSDASARFSIQRTEPWSICMVNLHPLRYGRSRSSDHAIAKQSRCVVNFLFSYRTSIPLSNWSFGLLGSSLNRIQPTCTSHASVSNIEYPSAQGMVKAGSDINISWSAFIAFRSLSFNFPNLTG